MNLLQVYYKFITSLLQVYYMLLQVYYKFITCCYKLFEKSVILCYIMVILGFSKTNGDSTSSAIIEIYLSLSSKR